MGMENTGRINAFKRIMISRMENLLAEKKKARIEHKEHPEKANCFVRILDILDLPFNYIRRYTILPCDEEEYEHHYSIYWPFLGILFLLIMIVKEPSVWWLLWIPISGVWYYYLSKHTEEGVPSYFMFIIFLSVLSGILWTKFCCGLLVDLLTVIGYQSNLSTTYLGLTILAVGNALPDGLTTISIAKSGKAMMGITGGIAGQLFGLLIGFGVAMLKMTLTSGKPLDFDLFNPKSFAKNELDLIVVSVAFLTLTFMFIYGICNSYRFDKKFAYILICIYFGMIAITTTIAVR